MDRTPNEASLSPTLENHFSNTGTLSLSATHFHGRVEREKRAVAPLFTLRKSMQGEGGGRDTTLMEFPILRGLDRERERGRVTEFDFVVFFF